MNGDRHWTPQSELLALPTTSYSVIKLERLDEGLKKLLDETTSALGGLDFSLPHPSVAVNSSNASERVEEFYTEALFKLVRKLYARDFDEFGYCSEWP